MIYIVLKMMDSHHFKMYKKKTHLWFCSVCSLGDVSKGNVRKHLVSHGGTASLIGPVPAVTTVSCDDMNSVKRRRITPEGRGIPQDVENMSEFILAHYRYTFSKHIPKYSIRPTEYTSRIKRIITNSGYQTILDTTRNDETFEDVLVSLFRFSIGDLSVDDHKIIWKFGSSPVYALLGSVRVDIKGEKDTQTRIIRDFLCPLFDNFYQYLRNTSYESENLPGLLEKWLVAAQGENSTVLMRKMLESPGVFWNRVLPFIHVIPEDPIEFPMQQLKR
jgi:hypothetical protein